MSFYDMIPDTGLVIISGGPGTLKTTIACDLALSKKYGGHALRVASGEMSERGMISRLLSFRRTENYDLLEGVPVHVGVIDPRDGIWEQDQWKDSRRKTVLLADCAERLFSIGIGEIALLRNLAPSLLIIATMGASKDIRPSGGEPRKASVADVHAHVISSQAVLDSLGEPMSHVVLHVQHRAAESARFSVIWQQPHLAYFADNWAIASKEREQ